MTIHEATFKKPTAVYRLYDADSNLLYVGASHTPDKRFKEHAFENQHWWPEVWRKSLTWHPNRLEAETAERDAIAAEQPRYNVMPGAITTNYAEVKRLAKAKAEAEAEAAAKAEAAKESLEPAQPDSSMAAEPNVICHVHELTPHAHVAQWCSARWWCAGCRTWLDGKPCKGQRRAVVDLARLPA